MNRHVYRWTHLLGTGFMIAWLVCGFLAKYN
jgi:hypothetical protein